MRTIRTIRTYTELCKLKTFEERFEYLRLDGKVGESTFGYDRYLNQEFYQHSPKWKKIRDKVIMRDNGCDLGIEGHEIFKRIIVHHMNPLTKFDILEMTEYVTDPEYLICTIKNTHDAIHYGDSGLLITKPIIRTANDTCPWKQ